VTFFIPVLWIQIRKFLYGSGSIQLQKHLPRHSITHLFDLSPDGLPNIRNEHIILLNVLFRS
jgi:hypothetical protein